VLRKVSTLLVILCFVSLAHGAGVASINVGSWSLLPDTPGQTIPIYVTGGALVQGLEFNVQIADGASGPVLQDVDILNGTIFEPSNDGIFPGSYLLPHLAYQGTTTIQGLDVGYGPSLVCADGLLATLTIDTTGIFEGSYALLLSDTLEGTTNFAGIPVDITNGTIIVPEPLTLGLVLFGSAGLLRRRAR